MKYFPIGLDLRNRPCVVVGGGSIGTRKASSLLGAGAKVTVVAPEVTRELRTRAASEELVWKRRTFRDEDLDGAFLAVAATDNEELNSAVVDGARQRNLMVCDASSAARSGFIFGAVHRDKEVVVAVFTDGVDPSLARTTRDRIARLLDRGGGG